MLQLVLGIAGVGKTTHLFGQIARRAAEKKHSILLVPEQFSSSAEAMAYHSLGDEKNAFVQVLSFRTMAERILKMCGGITLQVMTDAARAVFVRRALDAVAQEHLAIFARQRRSAAFCAACADTINELKTAGATPEILQEVAREEADAKLAEIAHIWQAYEAGIQGAAMDPGDRLTLAAERAACGYFDGTACFIDNFDGFTAPEYGLLRQVLRHCDEVTVALCCDALQESDGGLGRFSPVRHTAARLRQQAADLGCGEAPALVLREIYRSEKNDIRCVNALLAGVPDMICPPQEDRAVFVSEALDDGQEIFLVAAQMHRLAQRGVPYGRMTLVCRDIAQYEGAVRRQLGLFDIPLFVDAPGTVEYTAPVAFVRAGLALLRQGLVSEAILALLKTGLCKYTESEIAALENYLYTWAPKADDWRRAFEKNPGGLLAKLDDEAVAQMQMAEKVRGEVVPRLEKFIHAGRRVAGAELAKRLYLLLDSFGAAEQCEETARRLEAVGEATFADETRRAWDVTMELLDQMALLLGDEVLGAQEYLELFLLLVRCTDFGHLPQSLECVTFTSADRMRLADPAYCFVVGLCEGEFPMEVGYSGLLTHADRERLVEHRVEMPGSFENRVLLEEMFFYRALTAAHDGLYLSWPKRKDGVVCTMSANLEPLRQRLEPPRLQLEEQDLAATPAAAFDRLAHLYRQNTPEAAGLYAALKNTGGDWAKGVLPLLQSVDNGGAFSVADAEAIRRIVGEEMVLSATRAERYFSCQFSYYMERILGVRPRRKAELSPLESGTFVHYILEQVLRDTAEDFAHCPNERLEQLAGVHADAFVAENLPLATRRSGYLLGQIKQATAGLLCFMRDAAAASDFTISDLELPIGTGEDGIAPLCVAAPDGRRIQVTGKVDRVDVLRREGKTYVSIIDYKTGDKRFNLADVYCGINMQMMIYMQAICQNVSEKYPNPVPAAILYLTGDPRPESGQRGQGEKSGYKMDGLLLQRDDILQAMDRDRSGAFLPLRYKKDGSLMAGKQLADAEKMGAIGRHVEKLLAEMADGVYAGAFPARPLVKSDGRPCDWCPYRAACRHENGRNEKMLEMPPDAFTDGGLAACDDRGTSPEGGDADA